MNLVNSYLNHIQIESGPTLMRPKYAKGKGPYNARTEPLVKKKFSKLKKQLQNTRLGSNHGGTPKVVPKIVTKSKTNVIKNKIGKLWKANMNIRNKTFKGAKNIAQKLYASVKKS